MGNVADVTLRPGISVEPALRGISYYQRVRRLRAGGYRGAFRSAGF
jgi:hypothetical protein